MNYDHTLSTANPTSPVFLGLDLSQGPGGNGYGSAAVSCVGDLHDDDNDNMTPDVPQNYTVVLEIGMPDKYGNPLFWETAVELDQTSDRSVCPFKCIPNALYRFRMISGDHNVRVLAV